MFCRLRIKLKNWKNIFNMKNLLKIIKTVVLFLCLGFCSLQSYFEIAQYFEYQIFTATSVEDVEVAPINLVFCDSVPIENQVKDFYE